MQDAVARVGGVLDTEHDRNRGSGASAEDVPCFALPQRSGPVSIPAEVVDVEVVEVVGECCADSVGTVGVDVAAVGDVGEDPFVADTIGAPPEGADIGVIETIFQLRIRPSRIRGTNARIQGGVGLVGIVVIA